MAGVVRQPERPVLCARDDSLGWGRGYGGDERTHRPSSAIRSETDLLDVILDEAPAFSLSRELGVLNTDEEADEIVLDPRCILVDGRRAAVIAVIAGEPIEALDRASVESQSLAEVRVDMPAEQHFFVEPVDREEVRAEAELEVARCVEPDPVVAERVLIEPEARA